MPSPSVSLVETIVEFVIHAWQNRKIQTNCYSGRDAKPCQNFWRFLRRISLFVSLNDGKKRESVQLLLPSCSASVCPSLPAVCRSVPHIGSHSTACPVPDWRMQVSDKGVRAVCHLWNFSAGKVKVKWLFTAKLQNVVFGMSVNPLKILIFARSEICTLFFFPRPHTVDDGEWWQTFQPACRTASVKSCSAD